MSLSSETTITLEEKPYTLQLEWDEGKDLVTKLSFKPHFNISQEPTSSRQTYENINKSALSFQDKYIALRLFENGLEKIKETPLEEIPAQVCPCFKIAHSHVSWKAHHYHPDHHQKSLKDYLIASFPFGSACDSCMPLLDSIVRDFNRENFRENEWQGKTNAQWIKDLFIQLPQEVELLDFYNGKLFLRTELPAQELAEILKNYFSLEFLVICLAENN